MGASGRFFLAYVIHSLKKVVGLLAFERTGSLRREDRRKTHPDGCETAEDVGAFFPKEEPKQCPWERIAFVSDLRLYPDEVIVTDGSREFTEYTTLRSWVRQWLNYVKWYYMVAVSPGVTIQDLLDAPFVNRKWQVESTDSQLVRFGLVWKAYLLCSASPAKRFLYVMFCEMTPYARANLAYRSCKPIVPFGLTPEGALLWGPYIKDLIRVLIKLAKPVSVRSIKWREESKRPSFLGVLWYPRVRYYFDENNELFSRMDMASFEKEVIPNDPRGMVGRFVSLNPATGLAPSDIRSMVRSLVICLTHASEVRGAAKVNAQLQL
ncbi:hypothetical protein TanjilG_09914 [Lupinus angustifolius]|uniref:Uncharacterized protein n=1 Tax=Lupinus angustifolius TaxID=3871 RepID=A0A1J7H7E4_LUPAN|nr:hypothetical protein TanjilG_09914 [Lupinus angustifolius]